MPNEIWPLWQDRLAEIISVKNEIIEGGLRLRGVLKSSQKGLPLISYVTVVRNNEKLIARTLESVKRQNYNNIEHIVVDGASTDATLDIIRKHSDQIDYYASEPDGGLYEALNKAIPLCRGDLICVLNSDDWLPEDAAKIVAEEFLGYEKELILGAAKVKLTSKEETLWAPGEVSLNSYFSIANCCHNAIYATKGAYEVSGPYSTTYKIASDFKWIMDCFDKEVAFHYTNRVLVNYSLGGLSSDGGLHLIESRSIAACRFPYLRDEEIEILSYIYYPWKDTLKIKRNFRHECEIEKIKEKYIDKPDLIAAISLSEEKLEYVNSKKDFFVSRTANILTKYPRVHSIARFLYRRLSGREVG